ncbi:hypothetical protein PIOMA14_I_1434 [Prevotella intermedia]|uniref:Uncharacterized protein n=1 Tax=Prevotella intermedia TaxID=28131 RepID=A0A0S3UKF5_PREIN|nr:hypothetical protein PIOMA14_I_1434 [Prevotella intermedia]
MLCMLDFLPLYYNSTIQWNRAEPTTYDEFLAYGELKQVWKLWTTALYTSLS